MVRVTDDLALSPDHVTLYHATDPLLGHLPILIFYGPSTTANYTFNSSRVQVHIFTPAGFQSFPRLTLSPNSNFYSAVNHLPREFQVDEVYRALAFGLFKYFTELPNGVKTYLKNLYPTTRGRRPGSAPTSFGEQHTADLVKSMVKSENTAEVIESLHAALQTQHINNIDIDFVLPPGAIVPLQASDLEDVPDDEDDILDPTLRQYEGYTPLVKLLGEPIFLPTSRLRRAPSKPTSLNRSKSFSKDQKLDLRFKLGELLDTEDRYVAKVRELVDKIARDFRASAKERQPQSLSPSEKELEKLFPQSADGILKVNSLFLEELRRVMDESEDDAMRDVDTPSVSLAGARGNSNAARSKDPSGALAVARLFLEWFPKFTECYQAYIKSSQHFPQLLTSFLSQQSSFRQRVTTMGEQSVRSILIEPVQRLPRYSLFIDQIVGSLPITHPALQPMLKARDIITNICSMDDPLPDKPHVASRLRNMVEAWPMDLEPQGRLMLAADFVELAPPFQDSSIQLDNVGVLLLFSDCVALLKKTGGTMTGRDLMREIDKPSAAGLLMSMTNAAGGPALYEFAFTGWHNLADTRLTTSADGSLVWLTSTKDMKSAHGGEHRVSKWPTSRCFYLQESLEGKAAKLDEDVVKARVEARFSESEREDPCWTLRSVRMLDNNLGLHAAVFSEGVDQLYEGRREPAPVRVVIDHGKGTKGAPVGHYGIEVVVNITTNDLKRISLLTVGLLGKQFQDDVALEDLLPTMSRRIIQLLSTQFSVSNSQLTGPFVSYYCKVLRSLSLSTRTEKTRSFLSTSPVKMLSNLWASNSNVAAADTPNPTHKHQRQVPSLSRNNSQLSFFGSLKGKDVDRTATDDVRPENPLLKLEQTFAAYVSALRSRGGVIIGRTLLNRSMADELSVNDLYNRLIENPSDVESATELSTEVIFVAFEKFLHIAWAEQMGSVMTIQALDTLQERANRRMPGDFADFVNYLFGDMAPQNRRAFTALVRLLNLLLDGCGTDSDRGALTLAFAELLVPDGSAANYINLLDRLVEDCDRIFDEPGLNHSFNLDDAAYESITSAIRGGKSHTGSMTSNTSSLRRKFGLDMLLRQNSKDDRASVWRSLSKPRNPATGEASSISKGSLGRTHSIDDNGVLKPRSRPTSRDRPPTAGTYEDGSRPTSSHRLEFPLNTIGEPGHQQAASSKNPRRKRRSSLSDLKSLMAAASLGGDDDEEKPKPLQLMKQTSEKINSANNTSAWPSSQHSPGSAQALRSPRQKENVADFFTSKTSAEASNQLKPESPAKHLRQSKTLSASNIPTLKSTRSDTTGFSSATRAGAASPTRPATQKLRLQSPQKLRERMQTEKMAIHEVDASLQVELQRIGEEMGRLGQGGLSNGQATDLRQLTASVNALEAKVPSEMGQLLEKQVAIERDMEMTLKASEAKVKAIDQLYKEAMAENELLYERFNGELGKIVRALKGKGKEEKEELVAKLKDQSDEAARVKKENARLRREMVSLRAALKGSE